MRSVLLTLLLTLPALAQNWYVPDNAANAGTCNVIPFGSTATTSTFANSKMQTRCTVADLGGVPGVITGLAFASCATGRAHYASMEIVLDHIPASQPLSGTFAANLTANAQVVLSQTNHTWNLVSAQWNEIGLQLPFVYNGVDDLLVQITMSGGTAPAGMRRGTRDRVYWTAASGTPPLVGSLTATATKIEVSMLTAHTSSYGDGCVGSNGVPLLGFSGSAVLGNTLSFDLTRGVPNGIALMILGFTNGAPFPVDLGFLGMPGCTEYVDLGFTNAQLIDPVGATSFALPVPATLSPGFLLYGQYSVLDPAANAFGFTMSNYGRALLGN